MDSLLRIQGKSDVLFPIVCFLSETQYLIVTELLLNIYLTIIEVLTAPMI